MKDTITAKRWDFVPDEFTEVGVEEIYSLICDKDDTNLFTMIVCYNKSENNMIYEILPVVKDEDGYNCTLYDVLYSKSISGITKDQIIETINSEVKNMFPIWIDGDEGFTYFISFDDEIHTTLSLFRPTDASFTHIGKTGTPEDTVSYRIESQPCDIDNDGSFLIYVFDSNTLTEKEIGVLFLR